MDIMEKARRISFVVTQIDQYTAELKKLLGPEPLTEPVSEPDPKNEPEMVNSPPPTMTPEIIGPRRGRPPGSKNKKAPEALPLPVTPAVSDELPWGGSEPPKTADPAVVPDAPAEDDVGF